MVCLWHMLVLLADGLGELRRKMNSCRIDGIVDGGANHDATPVREFLYAHSRTGFE